jgi:DNA-binding LytR/AlgR family response regulator
MSTYSMKKLVHILIVEDELVLAANLSNQLTSLGFYVMGIIPRANEALLFLQNNTPDLVFIDFQLKGSMNGIQMANEITSRYRLPIIFLTNFRDQEPINKALETNPYRCIAKPCRKFELQRVLSIAINDTIEDEFKINQSMPQAAFPRVYSEAIFVKHNDKRIKVQTKDVLYIEAERNYSVVKTIDKSYLLVMTLKELEKKLPEESFVRIHRSYIVHLAQINEVAKTYVVINNQTIPISKLFRDQLLKRLYTL